METGLGNFGDLWVKWQTGVKDNPEISGLIFNMSVEGT